MMGESKAMYRIYTEYSEALWETARVLVEHSFDSYTYYETKGVWKGAAERSVIIEIIGDDSVTDWQVKLVAEMIRSVNKQESVLVTKQVVEATLVTGEKR